MRTSTLSVAQLYERGDLLAAARREADCCDKDGYWLTAKILRELADKAEATAE